MFERPPLMSFTGSYSQAFIAVSTSPGWVFRKSNSDACPVTCTCFCERSLVQQIVYSVVEEYQADVIAVHAEARAIGILSDSTCTCRHVQDVNYEFAHLFRAECFVFALG